MSRWVKAEQGPDKKATKNHSALNLNAQDELLQLRKENEQLRMEREILKRPQSSLRKKPNKICIYSCAREGVPCDSTVSCYEIQY